MALCHHTFLLLFWSFYMAVPNPASPSVSFLCKSRENNGENNTLFQEEAAVNLRITVSVRVVSKVGFLHRQCRNWGSLSWSQGLQEQSKLAKMLLVFRLDNPLVETHHHLWFLWGGWRTDTAGWMLLPQRRSSGGLDGSWGRWRC